MNLNKKNMAKKKSKKSAKFLGIAVLLLAGIGIYYYMSDDKKSDSNSNDTDSNSNNTDTNSNNTDSNSNDTDSNSNNTDTNSNNTDSNSNDTDSNSNNTDTNSNNTDSNSNTNNTKPYWYNFAHPSKKFSEITNEELEVLFDNIFIPNTAVRRFFQTDTVDRVDYIIMKNTGDIVDDIDHSFFTQLLNNAKDIYYSTETINNKYYHGINSVKK